MPRRTTLTYSSEDAQVAAGEDVFVYYCKYSGKHVLTTNCDLTKAPKRRTDESSVIDTRRFVVRLYTRDGGVKLIRRGEIVERQYRINKGNLPIGYYSELDGQYLYIFKNSLTTYSTEDKEKGVHAGAAPVPPCILPTDDGGTQISLEIDDRADVPAILKISADHIRIQIVHGIAHEAAGEELLEYMRAVLGVRLGQLSLLRGASTRHKLLVVEGHSPATVFHKVQATMKRGRH
eukprot:jgi/Botrbrau1/20986/Bobra.0144s0005.1